MMTDTTREHQITSADLLAELREEQQSFRFLMTALAAIIGMAAVIVAGSVIYFYMQLSGLKQQYAEQTRLNEMNLRIVAGEAGRQRESTQAAIVAIREENEAARRQADLAREIQRADSVSQASGYKDNAMELAQQHFLGVPLNEVTAQVVGVVLRADGTDGELLSTEERLQLQAALEDWGGQNIEAVRASMTALLENSDSLEAQARGAAGLAALEYRAANDLSLGWNRGCSTVVDYVNQAAARGLEAPMLLLWKGQCLRKRGDALLAYQAFSKAAGMLEGGDFDETLLQAQIAHHGVGTTLVALVASEQLPSGRDSESALQEALAELREAARLRAERGATAVGVAYTEENIGFIHILDEDWQTALDHTKRIDDILPLAWNLTVRNIAAMENEQALRRSNGAREDIRRMQKIQDDTKLVLGLMSCNQIDRPELKRLLPARYSPQIDELSRHCDADAGGSP
ncbi:hypothetical protein [Henriciella pelagia]|jgi:tetratricopeptide (TPR) repeat protein|uniref:Tetratricopeptide repeat protein n=2 Tax=Henriciella pelagia TaxID=1977912 RepID=A0ABQ1JHU7_9PROT|nr:hypothetical protein [Henriciella pelagia]GGB68801.1 hypothetical protein GCM10011503_16750 [Henriciella pelagia]